MESDNKYFASTEAQVNRLAIIKAHVGGETIVSLSKRYGVTRKIIYQILEADKTFDLKLRRWSSSEKLAVQKLRSEGYTPSQIVKKTGFPLGQVKFWVYGTRKKSNSPKSPSPNRAKNSARKYYRDKYNNWYVWKATALSSSWRRQAKKLNRTYELTPRLIAAWLVEQPEVCYYCEVKITPNNIGVDHKQPISREGSLGLDNLAVCCRECNSAKGSLDETEFKQLLALIGQWSEVSRKSLLGRLKYAGSKFGLK